MIVNPSEYIINLPSTPKASFWQLLLSCIYSVKLKSKRYQGSGWIDRVLLEDIYTFRWTRCVKRNTNTIATSPYVRDENDKLLPAPWSKDMENYNGTGENTV